MNDKPRRRLGRTMSVFPLGLGCMGLTGAYGEVSEEGAKEVIHAALDQGIDLFDTADFYGGGRNEELLGRYLDGRQARISTKTGFGMGPDRKPVLKGKPEQIRAACDSSLKRLRVDRIDLYLLARIDPEVPVEESVGAMAELVSAGKVREIGLSEVSVPTLARANAVHPLAVLESEYSLGERSVEQEILPAVERAGMTLIAYSPLGRGLLGGGVTAGTRFQQGDFRLSNPRFSPENLPANAERASLLAGIAREAGMTAAQAALAWLLARPENVIPIFGAMSPERVKDNVAAASLRLAPELVSRLDEAFAPGWARGARYPEAQMALVDA